MARTREENREYMRSYRAKQRADGQGATVTQLRPSSDSVVSAVREEVASLPMAERRPADVAIALAMAQILDDPESIPQQPQAANRLREVLEALRKEGDGRAKSKLTILQERRAERDHRTARFDAEPSGVDA